MGLKPELHRARFRLADVFADEATVAALSPDFVPGIEVKATPALTTLYDLFSRTEYFSCEGIPAAGQALMFHFDLPFAVGRSCISLVAALGKMGSAMRIASPYSHALIGPPYAGVWPSVQARVAGAPVIAGGKSAFCFPASFCVVKNRRDGSRQ